MVKSDISGFIVKKKEEDDPTGKRLKLLEKYCEKYEIPLVEIPEDLYYWGIIRHVMTQVFDKDTARLKYFKITYDNFNTFILKNNGLSNTASDIIKFLSIMIENPVYCIMVILIVWFQQTRTTSFHLLHILKFRNNIGFIWLNFI